MGKIDMGIIHGKLYNSQTRTFLIRTGEKFIDETGQSDYDCHDLFSSSVASHSSDVS